MEKPASSDTPQNKPNQTQFQTIKANFKRSSVVRNIAPYSTTPLHQRDPEGYSTLEKRSLLCGSFGVE